jgi:hypothetical protein
VYPSSLIGVQTIFKGVPMLDEERALFNIIFSTTDMG